MYVHGASKDTYHKQSIKQLNKLKNRMHYGSENDDGHKQNKTSC